MNSLTSLEEIRNMLESHEYSFIMFSAKWCNACKKIKPKIETLIDLYKDINFNYVDITNFNDDEDKVLNTYKVEKLPSFMLYTNSTEYTRVEGSKNKSLILTNLNKLNSFIQNNIKIED